tara:strand:- start:2983 stop:3429 length:447 start_codon:yes stop_codon:yes gene_type:complete
MTKSILKPIPKSVLSLDVGRKRIGIAGCDPLGITVTRLPAIFRKDFNTDLKQFIARCKERNVKGLIIGLPLNKKGEETSQSLYCKRYGKRLGQSLGLPIAWVNEHSSSLTAKERLRLKDDRSGKIDSEAAAIILEQWLFEGPDLINED